MLSRARGSWSTQPMFDVEMRRGLSCLWSRSTMPLAQGWYAVVRMRCVPREVMRECQRSDSNCGPLSVVMVSGQPNRDTQPEMKEVATVLAVTSFMGTASGQRVKRSTIVSR